MLFLRACCYSAINKIFDVLPEVLIDVAIDIVAGRQARIAQYFPNTSSKQQLFILTLITLFVWTFESLFEYLHATAWRRLTQITQHRLRLDAFWHIEYLSLEYIESTSPGRFTSILNDDVNQLERFLDTGINTLIHLIIGTLVISALFIYSSATLAYWALLPLPGVLAIALYYYRKLAPGYKAVRIAASNIASFLTAAILGITTIKAYSTEKYELERLKQASLTYQEKNKQVTTISASFAPAMRMVIVIGFVLTLLVGGILVLDGRITIGIYSMLVLLIQRLLWPFINLPGTIDLYQRSMAAAQRVFELLATPLTITEGIQRVTTKQVTGTIEFRHVSFSYPNGVCVFNNLSLAIPAKTTVAFVGSTGSGKSTLAKLILRFYTNTQGSIFIDNTAIEDYVLHDLRHIIGYVSQEVFLVDGTIAENIAYGSFNASPEQIIQAAQDAHAYEFITELPQGFDTRLGDLGCQLSQGQKQRISLARAFVKKPAIYIFDEATSAVDNETESLINQSIARLTHNNTVIIITHRLSVARTVDVIYVLDHGTVLESGSHQELLKQGGVYANLWNLQCKLTS